MKGLIRKSTGSWYAVRAQDGAEINCRVRGKLRLEGIKESNPLAVGDWVEYEILSNEGIITEIHPRSNHILRQSVKKTGHSQVLAANVDQVMLMATIKQPRTSLGFIDRFLVSAESFRIPQILLFNKTDILNEEDKKVQNDLAELYSKLDVQVRFISVLTDNTEVLLPLFENKITLLAGHSGVGKSSLLNKLVPELDQAIGAISGFSDKGVHTTTFAEMFTIGAKSYIIDTPGVKEWGLVDMNQQEISDYFPEMREVRLDCKFGSRCIHVNEPKCAVLDAVEKGEIAASRYESYISMVSGQDNRK